MVNASGVMETKGQRWIRLRLGEGEGEGEGEKNELT